MSPQQKSDIDSFIEALEEMMDARDDMWEEEKYSNHRQMWQIKSERYEPAREKVRVFLQQVIEKIVKN
jgi:hypothetical protein